MGKININTKLFGERLKKSLESINENTYTLAEHVSLSPATISRYVNGIMTPKITTLYAIADFLKVDPIWLMGGDHKEDLQQFTSFGKSISHNIIPLKNPCKIPVVGVIHAGEPILAEQNITGYELADVADPGEYFYLRVTGDSMINANISDGDLVLIKMQHCAENGQIVACIVNGDEATLKRYRQQKDMVILQPENSHYEPIIVPANEFESGYAQIIGIATELKRKLS